MDRAQLLQQLPQPQFKKVRISGRQTAQEIIKEIRAAHRLYAEHYKRIAEHFRGATAKQAARKVWDFLKQNISYTIESSAWQSSKSPAMLLTEGKGDCKHYSLFTAGILTALGYRCVFRFASYKLGNPTPQHVYVMVELENGELMPVDAVIEEFGVEKPYTFKQDYSVKKDMLYRISGIADAYDTEIGRSPRRAARRAARRQRRAQRRAEGKGFFRRLGRGLAKVALAPARNAYLVLLGLNFRGMAKRLNEAIKRNPEKVKNLWVRKLKGSWKALLKNVARGSRKGQRFTPAQVAGFIGYYGEGIGAAPLAGALAAAAPIIAAIASLVKDIVGPKGAKQEKEITEEATRELAKNPEPNTRDINAAVSHLENQSRQIDNNIPAGGAVNQPIENQGRQIDNADGTPAPEVKANNNIMLIGVAALAALALMSNKRK